MWMAEIGLRSDHKNVKAGNLKRQLLRDSSPADAIEITNLM